MLFRVILLFFAVKCYKNFNNGFENVIDVTGKSEFLIATSLTKSFVNFLTLTSFFSFSLHSQHGKSQIQQRIGGEPLGDL